jgi:predicted secreted acid phosphatase
MKHSLHMLIRFLTTLNLVLIFSSQTYAEPPNLSLLKEKIIAYHDSGQYQHELAHVIHQAKKYIMQQALLNQHHNHKQKLALVLDIDETSLSNYPNMVKRDFALNLTQINNELLKANDPAIKPTLALYNYAQKHGITVFFVTGRNVGLRAATQLNLHKVGYKNWAGLYLRPMNYANKSIIPFKSKARADISAQGYTIIASIGDQFSDLKGGYTHKGFKLPNPYYYLP